MPSNRICPDISVIIPVHNDEINLRRTVRSIQQTCSSATQLEFVIVDDASAKPVPRAFQKLNDGCMRVLRSDRQLGVARARNRGALAARGEILFVTDSHVTLSGNWDRVVLSHFRPNRILAATITDQASEFKGYGCNLVIPYMGTKWNCRRRATPHRVQIASSAGTVLSRALFAKLGGFDPGMRLYGSAEPEFSLRAWLSDAEIVCIPQLEVCHRFKSQRECKRFLNRTRPYLIHNSLRFGLLYMSEPACLQMIRHYVMKFPHHVQEAFRMLNRSDVWERRSLLKATLKHPFSWFIEQFRCRDQVGMKPLI